MVAGVHKVFHAECVALYACGLRVCVYVTCVVSCELPRVCSEITSSSISSPDLTLTSTFEHLWLTYPLLTSSFPFVENALSEFQWSYQLPTAMYAVCVCVGCVPMCLWVSLSVCL